MRRNTLTKSSGGGSIRNVMQFSKMLILVILVIQPRRVPTVPTKIKSIGKASEEQDEQAPRDRSKTKKLNRDRSSNLNLYD